MFIFKEILFTIFKDLAKEQDFFGVNWIAMNFLNYDEKHYLLIGALPDTKNIKVNYSCAFFNFSFPASVAYHNILPVH